MDSLFNRILTAKDSLKKFRIENKITACIYPKPYNNAGEVVRWFYSRNDGCQVFFACSKETSDKIDAESWADVDYDFTVFIEQELMPFCVENTDWKGCCRYGIEYGKKVPNKRKSTSEKDNYSFDFGCHGGMCHCEPFGQGDFTYGIAEETEFNFE